MNPRDSHFRSLSEVLKGELIPVAHPDIIEGPGGMRVIESVSLGADEWVYIPRNIVDDVLRPVKRATNG
jgi:hypothetical protein